MLTIYMDYMDFPIVLVSYVYLLSIGLARINNEKAERMNATLNADILFHYFYDLNVF